MKKSSILLAALFVSAGAFAQQSHKAEVPQAVKAAFEKQYPNIKKVEWEKEDSNYEAEFDLNKVEHSVLYDASGKLLETEMEINPSELPEAVKTYVSTHYAGQKIKEAAKIVTPDGTLSYEAEVKGQDLIFDSKGQFIKTNAHE